MKRPFIAVVLFFAVVTGFATGRQLTGVYAPAPTPALPADTAQKKFTAPPGFEVRLFAAEPEVVNPVAMTWDERGRLWVVELFEYPLGAPAGTRPRDRIKILEDTDGDGRVDKVTVFADGLNLATGILLGYGGVFVGQAPNLLFLRDTNGDDVADERVVLKTGFGLDDRHELLNGFAWGPDGWLYMTQGVFTQSRVRNPSDSKETGVLMNAAVARYHPRTKEFEVFADGTSNPWGVDFDRTGNAFVSACVIDHLFQMSPGGLYQRQSGTPTFDYAYQLLPSIVDHRHFRAAYSGVQVYQGDQYPKEYLGTIFMGNIHDNSVHQDRLTPNGSSFKASFVRDFVRANDGWFRPVSTQVGPDGALWIMDWYDKYPCYQNAQADPEGVDRTYGRIWRVVYAGKEPGKKVPSRPDPKMNLGKLSSANLVQRLEHPNVWQRRMAQRLLSERQDASTRSALEGLLRSGTSLEGRLAALWTLHSSGLLREELLDQSAKDAEPALRAWAARLTGERRNPADESLERLRKLARDPDPTVRLAVAVAARQYISGSLTVNSAVPEALANADTGPILAALIRASMDNTDPLIPFMIWMAAEPRISEDPSWVLDWLLENGSATAPLSGELIRKSMRLICERRDPERMNVAAQFLRDAPSLDDPLIVAALEGLLQGQQGKAIPPSRPAASVLAALRSSPNHEVAERAERLGALWGDAASFQALIDRIGDANASDDERIKAMDAVRQLKNAAARQAVMTIVRQAGSEPLVLRAMRAAGQIGGDELDSELIERWARFTPAERRGAADVLVSRGSWAIRLLEAVQAKKIPVSDLGATTVRSLAQSNDPLIRERAAQAIGRVREADRDKLKMIAEKRKVVLDGPADLDAGHEIAKKTCFVCHKLYGEGAEVGPDLTGVGRSTLDALLANVIDPNQIVGKGYENVEVETKDGRTVSGRMAENTESRVKILSSGPKEEVIARSDIASLRISELSVMPEGLEQMPDRDFRNLIWFILNPPQDHRPMTASLRKQLTN